jgi:hypothetical protein
MIKLKKYELKKKTNLDESPKTMLISQTYNPLKS